MTNLNDLNPLPLKSETVEHQAPLAWRMRPRDLSEFLGQEHLLGPGKVLRRALEEGRSPSLLLYGPPGCGKTALAHLIAARTGARFHDVNAVTSGVQEIRQILAEARRQGSGEGRRTLVFVDEIHRFNKVQQSALLPDLERGTVTLIGASTQNPSFAIIAALASRSRVCELRALEPEAIKQLLWRALQSPDRGLGRSGATATPEAIDHLARSSDGDARRALNALEIGVLTAPPNESGHIIVDLAAAQGSVGKKALAYGTDDHYDTISAFIKSMRGSDPDAAIYWLAKMLYAGEDPLYIARRIIICAAEDVGNADPHALQVAVASLQALEAVGMPEGQIPLAQAALYVACAPKSHAVYQGIREALQEIEHQALQRVPGHLQDASTPGSQRLGRGAGYLYPHDFPGHYVSQSYMTMKKRFYRPGEEGFEKAIRRRLEELHKNDPNHSLPRQGPEEKPEKSLTTPGQTTSEKEEV